MKTLRKLMIIPLLLLLIFASAFAQPGIVSEETINSNRKILLVLYSIFVGNRVTNNKKKTGANR